jgi:hypothetical protein
LNGVATVQYSAGATHLDTAHRNIAYTLPCLLDHLISSNPQRVLGDNIIAFVESNIPLPLLLDDAGYQCSE